MIGFICVRFSSMCVSMCGGRSVRLLPKADTRPQWNGIRLVLLIFLCQCALDSPVPAILCFFPSVLLSCNGRFYNNHTACVLVLPLFSPVRMGFMFLYSSRSACALLLHPSLPSTATPGTSSAGNSWWQWLMLLGLILGFCRPRLVKDERCITPYHLLLLV